MKKNESRFSNKETNGQINIGKGIGLVNHGRGHHNNFTPFDDDNDSNSASLFLHGAQLIKPWD